MRSLQSPTPILDLVFPRRCPICDKPVRPYGSLICEECAVVPQPVGDCTCFKCGKPVGEQEEYCADCSRKKHMYYRGAASFRYRSVSGSLYRFKYEGRREYADYYGREMALTFDRFTQEMGAAHVPDLLVPVPCSEQRERKRGYNQAAVLAEKLAEIVRIPVDSSSLKRAKDTKAMRTMSATERQNNLKKAFHAYGNSVRLKSIMLIDDIYTTGATVDACALALLEAGAREVSFLTFAIGENGL